MKFIRMGVLNVTPNSFSDGGDYFSPSNLKIRIKFLDQFEIIDIGAESTAPMNQSIPWQMEWERWQMVLPYLKGLKAKISIDTYHPETIFEILKFASDHLQGQKLIWNDVSGKIDDAVKDFLKTGHEYIFCHNLAPSRSQTGKHMNFCQSRLELVDYFSQMKHPQIIFDPCLGFSKSYEQNWWILENFGDLVKQIDHPRWVLGFSRKSFLKRKFQTEEIEVLDQHHLSILHRSLNGFCQEVWVRTHRPELLPTSI